MTQIDLMQLTGIDVVLLALVLTGGAWGCLAGAVRLAIPFSAVVASIALVHAYPEVSSRFEGTRTVQVVGLLLLAFIGIVIFGFLARILHGAVHVAGFGPINRLLGLVLGLVMGVIVGGAVVWGLETYDAPQAAVLLHGSALARRRPGPGHFRRRENSRQDL